MFRAMILVATLIGLLSLPFGSAVACDDQRQGEGWPCKNIVGVSTPVEPPVIGHEKIPYPCRHGGTCTVESFMRNRNVCSLYVIKDGNHVYHRNRDSDECTPKHMANRYGLASVTKLVVAYLLGHVRQHATINLDTPVSAVFAAGGRSYPGKGTVRDVLHMTTGMKWDFEEKTKGIIRIHRKKNGAFVKGHERIIDSVDAFLAASPTFVSSPCNVGVPYCYSSFDSTLMGQIVEAHLSAIQGANLTSLADALEWFVWSKLPVQKNADWKADADGKNAGYCCLYSNPHDLALFGQLVLERYKRATSGSSDSMDQWAREMLDSKVPMGESCYFTSSRSLKYAYQWRIPSGGEKTFVAYGNNGQFIQVFPDLNAVVVQFASWGKYSSEKFCEALSVHAAMAKHSY